MFNIQKVSKVECTIGRRKECAEQGCAFKRAGATDCKDRVATTVLPILNNAPARKLIYFTEKCFYCEKPMKKGQVTKDHVLAKSLGGTNSKKNIVNCCKVCNTFKSNMTVEQFTLKLKTMLNNIQKL